MEISGDYVSLLINSLVMGFVAVILGYLVGYATKPFFTVSLPEVCNSWNKYRMMEVNLFIIGFLSTFLFCLFRNKVGTNINLKL